MTGIVCGGAASTFDWNANAVRRRLDLVFGNEYRVSLCGPAVTRNTLLYITTANGTKIVGACDDDGCGVPGGGSSVTFVANVASTPATLYYAWVFDADNATPCTQMNPHVAWPASLTVECFGPLAVPVNDDPCGAVPLPVATSSCTAPVAGTTQGATATTTASLGAGALLPTLANCGGTVPPGYNGLDVWYSITVPATGLIGIELQEGGMCSGAFGLYRNTTVDCTNGPYEWISGPTNGYCVLDGVSGPQESPATVFDPARYGLAPGDVVYVRVWERGGTENGAFTICASNPPKPPGDDPCDAILLTATDPCVPAEYNTVNAQPLPAGLSILPGIFPMYCGTPGAPYAAPNAWSPVARDMWFRVVVPPTNNMTVTLFAGSLSDMAMQWYRPTGGICPPYGGSLTAISGAACHDNIGGGNLMPRINSNTAGIALTSGETIYIRVWNKKAAEYFYHGTFSICITPNYPPPNDNPCGAIALEAGAVCTYLPSSNENATNTGLSFAPGSSTAPAPCGTPPANFSDVWFTVDVPIDLTGPGNGMVFDTDDDEGTPAMDYTMAVYRDMSGLGCPTQVQLVQVGTCATGGSTGGNTLMPRLELLLGTITPGERLYVRVWAQTNSQQRPFSICASRKFPPACQGTYYDSGGPAGQYANSESLTRTHCPEKVGDVVTLDFSQFSLETGWDFLRIYNQSTGVPLAANLIGTFTGNSIPSRVSATVTAGNPNGCLIVVFTSDASITAPGYAYKVSCGPPPLPVAGACGINAYTPGLIAHPGSIQVYDPGGPGGTTYPGNLGVAGVGVPPFHAVYCPNSPGDMVTMTFTSFGIEASFDALYVFDANLTPGTNLSLPAVTATQFDSGNPAQETWDGPYNPPVPPVGGYWGTISPGTITATNATGCITLVFYTDGSVSSSGWEADVSCGPPPPPPPATPCDQVFCETTLPNACATGIVGDYGNNLTVGPTTTQTFCAGANRMLTTTFEMFNVEVSWDRMYVFEQNGAPTPGPGPFPTMIPSGNGVGLGPAPYGAGGYWGTTPPGPFTTSTTGGCLTFVFVTDGSVVRPGWRARNRCPLRAENDDPCASTAPINGAIVLTPGATCVPLSTSNLNSGSTPGVPAPGCGNYQGGDVWYRFTAPPSGRVYIDTKAGTLRDAAMALYSGVACGGPFTLVECDDDDGAGLMPAIDRMCDPLTPGGTYWLRVWGYGNSRGTFDICILEGPGTTSLQSDCNGAFSLCGSQSFNDVAYGNGCGPDIPPGSWGCLSGERQGSWYAFRTNAAGDLAMTITPSVPADIDWAIWQGSFGTLPTLPVGASCIPGAPIRCSFGSLANTMNSGGAGVNPTGATGMGRNAFAPATSVFSNPTPAQTDAVDGWVPGIIVGANQMYLLYVDDHHLNGASYNVTWTESPGPLMGCEILPVEALQLTAAPQVSAVDLLWSTTREQNSSHFVIERSSDGVHFTAIGRMNSVGHSERLTNYESVDDKPVTGLNYYRLQQVDVDGTTALSNIVTALFKPNSTTAMVVPNPTRDKAELLLSAAYDGALTVRVTDGSGRVVGTFQAPPGMGRMELPIAHLEAGSYTVHLITTNGEPHARTRFVKN